MTPGLPPLSVQDVIDITAEVDELNRARLMRSLKDAGADQDTILAELKQHDRYVGNITVLGIYAQTVAGATRIISLAAQRAGQTVPKLDPSNGMIQEAYRLLGWDFDKLMQGAADRDPTSSQSPSSGTG